MKQKSYTCWKFQQSKIPCSHAIADCLIYEIDYREFLAPFHFVSDNLKCWSTCFVPLGHPDYWPESRELPFVPNPAWKRKKEDQDQRALEMKWTTEILLLHQTFV